jgi:hypothetical protein
MVRINNIPIWLQYGATVGAILIGVIKNNNSVIFLGTSLLIFTRLYHIERIKREELEDILRQLPSDEMVTMEAKKASEFKTLSPYEKLIMIEGFTLGVKFIYKRLNTN